MSDHQSGNGYGERASGKRQYAALAAYRYEQLIAEASLVRLAETVGCWNARGAAVPRLSTSRRGRSPTRRRPEPRSSRKGGRKLIRQITADCVHSATSGHQHVTFGKVSMLAASHNA
jgi:hypothetical protein